MLLSSLVLFACSGDDRSPPGTDPPTTETTTTPPPVDTGTPPIETPVDRYDPEHLTVVVADLPPDDWYALSHQSRLYLDLLLGPTCFEGPVADIFDWYPGTVTVDDESLDDVGLRKKGLIGSMSWTRPSLKVDTDRFVDGQEFADDTEHITLNNNNQDPTRLHSCLAYTAFAAAGVPAPRCSYATVEVNGEDLGVYSNVEPIKKAFLRDNFGSDDGELYEGTASDFTDEWLGTFEIKEDGDTLDPLIELADVLLLDDDELMPALEAVVDVDAFLTFWATENLIGHWDGYAQGTNNFYVYHDPADGKLRFIPWGADAVFEDATLETPFVSGVLTQRLYNHPDGLQRYLAESQRLLDEVWDEAWLQAEVDRMEALVAPHVLDPVNHPAWVDTVRTFVDGRRAVAQAAIDAPPSHPEFPRTIGCLPEIGTLSATFSTTYDSLEDDPFVYPTTFSGDLYSVPLPTELVGTVLGPDGAGNQLLAVVAIDAPYTDLTQVLLVIPEELGPGTYPIDIATIPGYLISADLTDPYDYGSYDALLGGELTLDEVDWTPGGTVSGSIDSILVPFFF